MVSARSIRFDPVFKEHGRTHVPGFGMTPGITDMMAKYAIDRLDTIDTVRISHGALGPSPSPRR